MLGPVTRPPADLRRYVPRSTHQEWISRAYFQHGRKVASSRERRADYPDLSPGTWMIDEVPLAYGHEILELVELSPRDLTPMEFDWHDPPDALRHAGKWRDALRYAEWLDEGWRAPPISVVEAESGELRVTDGHRRLAAADMAGVPVLAWVSWLVDHPKGLRDAGSGRVMGVGLAYELAHDGEIATNPAFVEICEWPGMFVYAGDIEPNPEEPPLMRGHPIPAEFDPVGWRMSEKLDGVRGYWDGRTLVSRYGNIFASPAWFTKGWPKAKLDGEIFGGRGKFHETSGMARRHKPHEGWRKFVYVVFDLPDHPGTWEERQAALKLLVEAVDSPYLAIAKQVKVKSKDQVQLALEKVEHKGGEGLMLVDPGSRYVPRRTQSLFKVKSFEDDEGVVFRHVPGKGRNVGRMGALWLRDKEGLEFKVGSGFTDAEREQAATLFPPGTVITVQFFERTPKGKPRHPSYMRVRDEEPLARAANHRRRLAW